MGFPGSSDWPGSVDTAYGSGAPRVDNVDIAFDDDFNFQDIQIRQIQTWLGVTGDMIGDGLAASGPGGMVSPVASGGIAFQLAARNAFAGGDILSVGDAYDAAYVKKLGLDHAGILWTLGGIDAQTLLLIPNGALGAAGVTGRLQWDTVGLALNYDDGAAWNAIGPFAINGLQSSIETGRYDYTQQAVPVEEVIGQFMFDASKIPTGASARFRAQANPTFSVAGWARVRVYDLGPVGAPAAPVQITANSPNAYNLEFSASGLAYKETSVLTTHATTPAVGQIVLAKRMYEITLEQSSLAADTVDLGFAGIYTEV